MTRLASLSFIGLATALATALACGSVAAQTAFPSTLAGHAVLPAQSFVAAPKDAPADLQVSGKFTTPRRVEAIGTVEGLSAGRGTGVSVPFKGQPLQGHSGIKKMDDGTFWILTDNGAGAKANSPDFMLYLNHYKVDFKSGKFNRLHTVFLHDPDKKVPFRIVHEGTEQALPDRRGLRPRELPVRRRRAVDRRGVRPLPDQGRPEGQGARRVRHAGRRQGRALARPSAVTTPGAPNLGAVEFQVKRSKGFEGMARRPTAASSMRCWKARCGTPRPRTTRSVDGKEALRMLEFDVATEKWTGRHWKYVLEANGNAIGDFNMIDGTTGLDHRARQRRRHRRQGLPRRPEAHRLLPRHRQVQARRTRSS
jgi:hypothetical protein